MTDREPPQENPPKSSLPEPWLRGTHTQISAVQRAVLHALELAKEDLEKWCGALTDEELNARPANLPPSPFICGTSREASIAC